MMIMKIVIPSHLSGSRLGNASVWCILIVVSWVIIINVILYHDNIVITLRNTHHLVSASMMMISNSKPSRL